MGYMPDNPTRPATSSEDNFFPEFREDRPQMDYFLLVADWINEGAVPVL
jgi:hypothetical protein